MRFKRSRILSVIREQLHREPNKGDVKNPKSQLAFAKKNKFGGKGQKVPKCETDKPGEETADHTNEKDNFDGTDD